MSPPDQPPPDSENPQQESLLSLSESPQDSRRLEQLIVNFTRGIQACTESSLAVKTLVESYLNHAIGIIREDIALSSSSQFRRLEDLARGLRGIEMGNQQALGAMQQLILSFNADASLERGLVLQARDEIKNTAEELKKTTREITVKVATPPALIEESAVPIWWNALATDFGKLTWQHKWYIIGVGAVSISPLLKALPSIIDAFKLLVLGG